MTTFVFDLLIGMLFISGISMAAVGLYARRFTSRVPAATPFILLMFCAAAWALLYALDLLTTTLPLRIFYHDLRFLFLPFIPVIELWLVLAYVKKTTWLRRDWIAVVLVVPVIAAILGVTSQYHTLFRYNFSINSAGPIPVLQYTESPFFFIYNIYSFILLALAIILLVTESRKQGTLREMPTILLIIALAFPTVLNYITLTFQVPFTGINLTPVALWIAAILYAVALFRYRFLDIIPIARSRLIEALSKPVLVLDTDGRVIDMNPAAFSLFSLTHSSAFGRKIEELVPDWPDFLSLCRIGTAQKKDLVRSIRNSTHHYIGSAEPLLSRDGEIEGQLIFLQDVTDLKEAEAALREKTEELDQYFTTNLDLFCIADTDGFFRRLNPQWERSLGYPLAELEGKRFLDFVHPDDLPKTLAANADLNSQKEVLNFINRYRHKDGTYRWIEWRSIPKGGRIFAAARDITERKRTENALRESEEKYRTLVESSFDGIAIHQYGILVYVNRTAARLLGSEDPGAFIGKSAIDIVAPEYRGSVAERVQRAPEIALGLIREQFLRLDGTLIDVDVTTAPSIWEGKPAAYVTFRDITAQVHAENALRESEEKYRAIIEEMQDIFYRTDIAGKITMLSPSAAQLAGYDSLDQLLGRDVTSVYADPADRGRLLAAMKESGSVYAFPLDLIVRDGSIRHVTTSSHFYRDAAGNVQGVEGVIHDITDQWRAEDALRESEERYRTIIENIQDVYFRFDKESRLVMASPSAARTFGYNSVAEMLGGTAASIWKNPAERVRMIDAMRAHGGMVQDWEAELVKKEGTAFWASISGRLHVDEKGAYQGTEGIIRDISERKKMEEALKSALTKLNMLSSITRHDILNQITGLRTYLELSKEDLKGTRFEAFIDKEDEAAEAIQRQIEFTKYYQDIGVNAPKWQDAAAVIREAMAQLSLPAIHVDVTVGGIEVFADPLIVKVFFNLMENSLRHGEKVTAMSFSSRESGAGLVITYRDNGVGISVEDKKKLFQKGFGKHTGLGLFLSREILAITGITITENGEPGKGVQFEMTVPKEGYRHSG